jgi:hypothetical protein
MDGQDLAGAAAAGVARIARELGAQVVPEGADPAQLLAPAAALRVARQVELAARAEVGRQIGRAARCRRAPRHAGWSAGRRQSRGVRASTVRSISGRIRISCTTEAT